MSLPDSFGASPGYSAETSTLTLIQVFLYAIAALVVGAFFTVWTIQRKQEIAVMRAMGAPTRYLLGDGLGQAFVLLLVSTGVGVAVGTGAGSLVGGGAPFALTGAARPGGRPVARPRPRWAAAAITRIAAATRSARSDEPMSAGLSLSAVTLEVGDGEETLLAMDAVDLSVAPGEFVAIVGPSGAGKSSLLAVAGALVRPTSGDVRVAGEHLGPMGARERARVRRG